MNVPDSTPIPIPTFQLEGSDDAASPANLLEFVQGVLANFDSGDPSSTEPDKLVSWRHVISALTEGFLASFPTPQQLPWKAMHEKLILTEKSLQVISRIANSIDFLFVHPVDFAQRVIARLINLCLLLDLWIDMRVEKEERYLNPEELQRQAISASTAVLRSLGGSINMQKTEKLIPPYETLRRVLMGGLGSCKDIFLLSPILEFPLLVDLIATPRIQEFNRISNLEGKPFILVNRASCIPAFLTLIIELCIHAISPPVMSQWYFTDSIRHIVTAIRETLELLMSPSCAGSAAMKARALRRLGAAALSKLSLLPGLEEFVEVTRSQLMVHRLQVGPNLAYESFDSTFTELYETSTTASSTCPDMQPVITILSTESWGDAGDSVRALGRSYLMYMLPVIGEETLRVIENALGAGEKATIYAALLMKLKDHDAASASLTMEEKENETTNSKSAQWRALVRTNVQAIVEPVELTWMDDDCSLSDAQYVSRALDEIDRRYRGHLYNPGASARISLALHLSHLPCTLIHANESECLCTDERPAIDTISTFLVVATLLLDGAEEEVTARVRKTVFHALSRALRHHSSGYGKKKFEHVVELIARGMKDKDRGVRLRAGESFAELVQLHQRIGSGAWKRTERLFAIIYRIFNVAREYVKETALVTLGHVGKIAEAEVLGQTICCLIAQLGQRSLILTAAAHLQLQALSKYHKKTPYTLASPYMDMIAPFLVSRLISQSSLLDEACRLFSTSPTDFISVTLSRTLPQLFASCDVKVLETVCGRLDERLPQLFIKYAHHVLAYVFRLQGPGQTSKVLAFILNLLQQSAQSDIDLASLVRSCVVPLLAELVVVLGDEDPDQVESARQAVRKVERQMLSQRSGATPMQNTGAFLGSYVLGVVSQLNDLLQDVYGKRSLASKKMIVRSLGQLVTEVGSMVSNVAPQIMATLQTMIVIPQLADVTLDSWYTFLRTLDTRDLGAQVGSTSASIVAYWSSFSLHGREVAKQCLDFIIHDKGGDLGSHLDDVVDFSSIPQLASTHQSLLELRKGWSSRDRLQKILERLSSESLTVAEQSLYELRAFMVVNDEAFIRTLASGDVFDPMIGRILSSLFEVACRDGEDTETLRLLAFDCIGVLGAVDPDRFEVGINDTRMVMLSNFVDESESVSFALHLIRDVLVDAFRSTSDIKYQSYLAYAIQELLRFCKFTPALVSLTSTSSIPLKVRNRWNSLPKHVLETITPLLDSKFNLDPREPIQAEHPIYPAQKTYREWVQAWTSHLLTRVSGDRAKAIFHVFTAVVRYKDVGVAHHLLPHLVLNVLLSGNEEDAYRIRSELLAVLEDQVRLDSRSSPDKRVLSAQTVFMLMDHLNQWVRVIRHDVSNKRAESRRVRNNQPSSDAEEHLVKIDSILTSIDQGLMAKAALKCKAYARSLMNFELQILTLQADSPKSRELHEYYERLHEIYAYLDEPDGMEGVSTLVLSPSLEHQIRQHESTGRWTSAQSCWEVRLQHSPDNPEFHLGLLRCLRNLGHYDTLRTHVKGVLTRNPDWESLLIGFQVESEWMVGNWDEVRSLVEKSQSNVSQIVLAQVLLALREGNTSAISEALSNARRILGTPIVAAGTRGYRRSYGAVLDLHLVHELDIIHKTVNGISTSDRDSNGCNQIFDYLSERLSTRLNSTLPTFRTREPILSMRRTAFSISSATDPNVREAIGRSWLVSAKIARKAGHWQTAYSAMLQAQQCKAAFSFVESAKLMKDSGEPLRALQELENSMRLSGILEETNTTIIDLTKDNCDPKLKAKAHVLRARWMNDSDRYDVAYVAKLLGAGADLWPKWESGQFHLGQHHDECYKALPPQEQANRGTRMNLQTVRAYARAMRYGSKYIYQTVPRLLTLWLDMGEDQENCKGEVFFRLNNEVDRAIKSVPVYKWYTAFPQIVSRVGHSNNQVYGVLSDLISMVIQEYPKQALWMFTSVVKSTKPQRAQRGKKILDKLRSGNQNGVSKLINESLRMTEELLALCDHPIRNDSRTLSMNKDFPGLFRLAPSQLIIPLQESLTANLPPNSLHDATFQPFPVDTPTFNRFDDNIEVMRSLAKPRKITIQGSDGHIYMFLGKPKDDLRKDARLMDFNAIINKLLKSNSESRRRQLHIRTYGVVTLNEECGFIQWVPNTIPLRPILLKGYERRGVRAWSGEMQAVFEQIKKMPLDREVGPYFVKNILSSFPPIFHEWFIETFPEPTAWLASRMAYSRTAAVMSMVGFILGLGDRHCENILLDTSNGDVVHVDFNCLFDKGKTLETPERVPFRLSQNIVDGFGITGVEGVFRIACEVTMQLLRDNKDTLMSVLDAFVHDPLVEWEDEKRRKERERNNRATINLRALAKDALKPIDKKLKGIYTTSRERPEKETSTSSLVQMLIQEATDTANLARMYPGWAPWH